MTKDQKAILALTKRVAALEALLAQAWDEGAEDAIAEFSSDDFPPDGTTLDRFYGTNPYRGAGPACADCGKRGGLSGCPHCGKVVCQLCAEREGEFCCEG